MGLAELFDKMETHATIYDGSASVYEGDIPEKQNLYFGCNYKDIPTVTIRWSEKGRGFGEYTFQIINGELICNNECDSKETVKRILNIMVDQSKFVDEIEENET
jgi:hypothetical protein